jgi:SAM-dependent methyltransferase
MTQTRDAVKKIVPKPARDGVRNAYWAARRWEERTPQEIALRRLVDDLGGVVPAGPFAGMQSLTTLDDGCILPKLLGCYEEEIHAWIELLIDRAPSVVVDVGCASGWYTTGLAYRLPEAQVFGYDLETGPVGAGHTLGGGHPGALDRAAQLTRLNGFEDRVTLRSERLNPGSLGELIEPGRTLVFVDIDGPELELLNPQEDRRLLDADVLVEFHDHFDPNISGTIVKRFDETHDIYRIPALGRYPAHYSALSVFRSGWVRAAAVDERRPLNPRQEWAVMLRR